MKKIILLVAVALATLTTSAQENDGFKGKWFVMGQAGISVEKTGDATSTSYSIIPAVGTFVAPTTAVGLAVGYVGNTVDTGIEGVAKVTTDSFIIQPLVRQYWGVTDNFLIFGQASVPMAFADNVNSFGLQIAPGIDYFLSSNWSIEAQIGLVGFTSTNPDGGDKTTKFDLGVNSGLLDGVKIGVKYIF